jgi:hypothetical protein
LREAVTPVSGPFLNEIPILFFEYEYRFTEYEYEYEYEKNHWCELPATIMPDCTLFYGWIPIVQQPKFNPLVEGFLLTNSGFSS